MDIKSSGIKTLLGGWKDFMEANCNGSFDMRYLYFDYNSFHDHQVYFKNQRENQRAK